jgi:predicted phage-related endonuclease
VAIDYAARRYIGSTDVGPILAHYKPAMSSLAKYSNAVDVWLRLAHGIRQPKSDRMDRGLRLEPELRELYRSTVGWVEDPPGLLHHPEHEFIAGSPDGIAANGLCVEYKTTTVFARSAWGEPGSDLVPDTYATQCQFLMMLAGCSRCHVLVAFGVDGKDDEGAPTYEIESTAVYELARDEELVSALESSAVRFWGEYVATQKMPEGKPMHCIRDWKKLLKGQSTEDMEAAHGE